MVPSTQRALLDRYEVLRQLEAALAPAPGGVPPLEAVADLLPSAFRPEWPVWLRSLNGGNEAADPDLDAFSVGFVVRALERRDGRPVPGGPAGDSGFAGQTRAARQTLARLEQFARSELPIMLVGERGTGKGLLARWAHACRGGTPDTFFALNCSALPETLAEAELFGHERGAFTGAVSSRRGLFAAAHACGGGLLLDDVAEFAPSVQPKVLQVVEDGAYFPVGSDRPLSIRDGRRLRIYASSQPGSLHKLRPDLRDRLCALTLIIPPLRSRAPDILLVADDQVARLNAESGRRKRLTRAGRAVLLSYAWPGNIRQLMSVIGRAYVLSGDAETLDSEALGEALEEEAWLEHWSSARDAADPSGPDSAVATLREMEIRHIARVLRTHRGNITRTARALGLSRSTLQAKLRRHDGGMR